MNAEILVALLKYDVRRIAAETVGTRDEMRIVSVEKELLKQIAKMILKEVENMSEFYPCSEGLAELTDEGCLKSQPMPKMTVIENQNGISYLVLKTSGDYTLLCTDTGAEVQFIVAYKISTLPDGKMTWQQGHYFLKDIDAAIKFLKTAKP